MIKRKNISGSSLNFQSIQLLKKNNSRCERGVSFLIHNFSMSYLMEQRSKTLKANIKRAEIDHFIRVIFSLHLKLSEILRLKSADVLCLNGIVRKNGSNIQLLSY